MNLVSKVWKCLSRTVAVGKRYGAGNSQFENIDRDHVVSAKMFGHETLSGDCNFRIALQLPRRSKIDLSKRALGIHSKYFSPRDRKCLLRSIFISANNEYHIRFLLQRLSNNGKENGQLQFTIFRILSNKWKIKCFIHYWKLTQFRLDDLPKAVDLEKLLDLCSDLVYIWSDSDINYYQTNNIKKTRLERDCLSKSPSDVPI